MVQRSLEIKAVPFRCDGVRSARSAQGWCRDASCLVAARGDRRGRTSGTGPPRLRALCWACFLHHWSHHDVGCWVNFWRLAIFFFVTHIATNQGIEWLNHPRHERTGEALASLRERHGKTAGHAGPIIDAAFSGDLMATKDEKCMRLWRARDATLLRVVSACTGSGVAFSPCGHYIVTGNAKTKKIKVWGAAGGSAFSAGKAKITAGKV